MEAATWIGAVAAAVAAIVAAWQAVSAWNARKQAQDILDATKEHADAATQQAAAAAESVAVAREQLALARRQAGNVGQVKVEWVKDWRHGPVFGLLRLEAQGHHVLHDLRMRIVPPEDATLPSPSVAVLGSSPVDPSSGPIGVPVVGEPRPLRVSDAIWMRRRIQIAHTMIELPGEPWRLGDPKTPRACRTITVPQSVIDLLAVLLVERPAADNGLIFHQDGRPVPYSVMDKRPKAVAKRAGVPPLTWHALRHHAASVMIAAGVPVPAITAQLGHANPSITFSTHAHLLSDDAAAADTALSNAWGSADS